MLVAHTNADVPRGGVVDALADVVGLGERRPLRPRSASATDATGTRDKIVTFVPAEHAPAVIDALAAAGAGRIGRYERCAFTSTGEGTFRPRRAPLRPLATSAGPSTWPRSAWRWCWTDHAVGRSGTRCWPPTLRGAGLRPARTRRTSERPTRRRGWSGPGRRADPADHGGRPGPTPRGRPPDHGTRRQLRRRSRAGRSHGWRSRRERVTICSTTRGPPERRSTSPRTSGTTRRRRPWPGPTPPALIDISHWAAEWTWLPVVQRLLDEALRVLAPCPRSRVSPPLCTPIPGPRAIRVNPLARGMAGAVVTVRVSGCMAASPSCWTPWVNPPTMSPPRNELFIDAMANPQATSSNCRRVRSPVTTSSARKAGSHITSTDRDGSGRAPCSLSAYAREFSSATPR